MHIPGLLCLLTLLTCGPSLSALLDAPRTKEGIRKSKNEDDDDGFFFSTFFFLCAAAAKGRLFGLPRG